MQFTISIFWIGVIILTVAFSCALTAKYRRERDKAKFDLKLVLMGILAPHVSKVRRPIEVLDLIENGRWSGVILRNHQKRRDGIIRFDWQTTRWQIDWPGWACAPCGREEFSVGHTDGVWKKVMDGLTGSYI